MDPKKRAKLIFGRNKADFPNLSKVNYVAPPVTKKFTPKTSFVHNQVANKLKTNHDHL